MTIKQLHPHDTLIKWNSSLIPKHNQATHTSANSSVSSSCKEHETLTARTRSSHFPNLGTVTVTGMGIQLPSVLKTVKVIVRIVVEGSGNDKYIKGSKVVDTLLQIGHTNFDRNWPCKKQESKLVYHGRSSHIHYN